MKNIAHNIWILLIGILIPFMGCAPCFNTMQTARMLPPKKIEMTPNYTWYEDLSKEYQLKQYNYGGRLGIGLTPKISVYGHYGIAGFSEEIYDEYWSNINIVELGLKIKMTKPEDNKTLAALYFPVGTYFQDISDKIEYFQIQPTMILTRPILKRVDLLGSTVLVVSKVEDRKVGVTFVAQNIGLDIFIFEGFSLRPEFGIGSGVDNDARIFFLPSYQFSIGFSYAPSGYIK